MLAGAGDQLVDAATLIGEATLSIEQLLQDRPGGLLDLLHSKLADPVPSEAVLDERAVRWLPPSPRASKIVGVAINNSLGNQFAHRKSSEPAYFLKPPSALVGHGEPLVVLPDFGLTHPEPELAAVIGRRVRNVPVDQAADVVFGYTITNDITSPGLKDRDSMALELPITVDPAPEWRAVHQEDAHVLYLTYHARSKGCDTFAPMGPWLVTADSVPHPNDLAVRGYLDDEEVLTDSTANLSHSVPEVIAHISRYMTLEPGDIVHFGSAFQPTRPERYPTIRSIDISRLGSVLSVEIEGLGRLDNPIQRAI